MTSDISNDNTKPHAGSALASAHGQAAILLVESLIHGLIARQVISVVDAIEIVDVAADVNADLAAEVTELRASMNILDAISKSLGHDAPDK